MIRAVQRRVLVDFGIPGIPLCCYRAQIDAARQFAADATRQGLARVILDELVTEELAELPCHNLFQTPPSSSAFTSENSTHSRFLPYSDRLSRGT